MQAKREPGLHAAALVSVAVLLSVSAAADAASLGLALGEWRSEEQSLHQWAAALQQAARGVQDHHRPHAPAFTAGAPTALPAPAAAASAPTPPPAEPRPPTDRLLPAHLDLPPPTP